jgi:hypothetical protein
MRRSTNCHRVALSVSRVNPTNLISSDFAFEFPRATESTPARTGMLVAQMHEAHGANEGRAVFFSINRI